LIQDLDRCYGVLEAFGFGALAPSWEARFNLKDRRVRVETINGVVLGTAKRVDRDGALIVERENGETERVVAGDVIPLEE
jgi:biotin-(acetyl-CoA carboxylase) ligase